MVSAVSAVGAVGREALSVTGMASAAVDMGEAAVFKLRMEVADVLRLMHWWSEQSAWLHFWGLEELVGVVGVVCTVGAVEAFYMAGTEQLAWSGQSA